MLELFLTFVLMFVITAVATDTRAVGQGAALAIGFTVLLEVMFATMQGEIDKMFTPDVNAAQKAAFDAEMKKMRDSIRTNRLTLDRMQPLLRTMREVASDERVTPAEAEQLTREMHEINNAPAPKRK